MLQQGAGSIICLGNFLGWFRFKISLSKSDTDIKFLEAIGLLLERGSPSRSSRAVVELSGRVKQTLGPVGHMVLRKVVGQGTQPLLEATRYQKLWSLLAYL